MLFGDRDVTDLPTEERNIAQVFQFPVVYDTMTVRENLAFPLRNRGMDPAYIAARVQEIARMIGMDGVLDRKARRLTADAKQKISLGRGMVRKDVNAILFDEPLTVIDPQMKWELRTQLRELHREFGHTMIYVTHDQTEALTFAERVVVMHDGRVVQMGKPQELFETPAAHLRRLLHRLARHEPPRRPHRGRPRPPRRGDRRRSGRTTAPRPAAPRSASAPSTSG